jgi:hypothetical protein
VGTAAHGLFSSMGLRFVQVRQWAAANKDQGQKETQIPYSNDAYQSYLTHGIAYPNYDLLVLVYSLPGWSCQGVNVKFL